MVRALLAVERMTEVQLLERLRVIAVELEIPCTTQGDVRRRKQIPSEIAAIAGELLLRGTQLTMELRQG